MVAEVTKKQEETITTGVSSIGQLLQVLSDNYPELDNIHFKLAVDHNIVDNNFILNGNEEIALLPPFAGG